MALNWDTINRQRSIAPENCNRHLALLPETFTKAMIGALISSGVLVVGMQSYVYYNFTQVYDGNSLPSTDYGTSWEILYTTMAMASGSANVLVGFFLTCVIRANKRLMMIFGTIFSVIAGATSILAGLFAIGELFKLYDDGQTPQHVCVGADDYEPLKSTCVTWWWLELMVVVFSGFAFIANSACFVVLCIDICNGNYYQELKPLKLDSVESLTSVSTLPSSPYGEYSTISAVAIPRIKILQPKRNFKPDNGFAWAKTNGVGLYHVRQTAEGQRNPSSELRRSLTNRPSLPIVIRKNTTSVYFY